MGRGSATPCGARSSSSRLGIRYNLNLSAIPVGLCPPATMTGKPFTTCLWFDTKANREQPSSPMRVSS
jgi:hypothetical protein